MSDIAPINGPNPLGLNGSTGRSNHTATPTATPDRGSDRVELSDASVYLSKLKEQPAIRESLVARVRSEIADGTYLTEAKLDDAVEALAEDLA